MPGNGEAGGGLNNLVDGPNALHAAMARKRCNVGVASAERHANPVSISGADSSKGT